MRPAAALPPALVLLFLVSCASIDVTKLEIGRLEAELYDAGAARRGSAVVPGRLYRLELKAYPVSGGPVERPDYRGFVVESPNNSLQVTDREEDSLEMRADCETLRVIESGGFALSIGIKNNPFPKQTFHWDIDWEGYDRLDYSGKNGLDGEEGSDGRPGGNVPGSIAGVHGEDGENGEDGSPGGSGEEAVLYAFFYDVRGLSIKGIDTDRMICLHDAASGKTMLVPLRRVTVDASGARGGRGGDGGLGGEAGEGGRDGEPGDGGDGGRGGDGGTIRLYYVDPAVLELVGTNVNGGRGGNGGAGRFDGSSGRDGKPGKVMERKIDPEAMNGFMKGTEKAGIDPGRILYRERS
jgi:hypothetical protein